MSEPAKKSKSKPSRSKQSSSSSAPKLKVVIRRLPPNLPEAIFWQSVGQWVTDEATTWKLYVQGKLRTKLNRENTPSRAYVEFKTPEAVVTFNRDYNGHLFRDKQGNESFAVVEYAPFQKAPHEKRKADARMGTIEADEDFISFLNALNKPADPTPDVNELVAQAVSAATPASTPLLDALKAAKESSTIKGYHSHYRDQANPPRSRAQLLDDEQTYSRKAPLQSKTHPQSDPAAGVNSTEPPAKEEAAGKGKDKDKEREGGAKKGKNKQKPAPGSSAQPKSQQQQSKSTPQPPPSPSATRATAADPPRTRPVVGVNARGGLLAAIGAATETRTTGGSRKPSGRQRDASGSNTNPDAPAPSVPATPLPAGVLAIPPSALPTPASGSAPAKSRRGGKSRSRGGAGGGGASAGGESASTAPGATSAPVEMPRIDDPGQALPAAPPPQRGRGGRGRGGRGRGRGGGGGGTGEQHGAPTG